MASKDQKVKDPRGDADEAKDKKGASKKEVVPKKNPLPTPHEALQKNVVFVDKYVDTRDRLLLMRVMRYTGFVKRNVAIAHLKQIVDTYVEATRKVKLNSLLDQVEAQRKLKIVQTTSANVVPERSSKPGIAAVVAGGSGAGASPQGNASSAASSAGQQIKMPKPNGQASVEIDAYLHIVALSMAVQQGLVAEAGESARELAVHLHSFNRRTLDLFQARAWTIASQAAEASGSLSASLPALLAAHRTATLRHDEYGQAVALNTLLRAHILSRDFEAAQALLSKAPFPEDVSTAQLARHYYYTGRVRAVTQDYAEAHKALMQASRKSPASALGFRSVVSKFDLLVQLLMGEIPERSAFSPPEPSLRASLAPYLALTSAVRGGDLRAFATVVLTHTPAFTRDGTLTLVRRLEGSVIKAGLRRVSTSYSRISFTDIAARLSLGSGEDAEFLCVKAIADGIIDGELDHEGGFLSSHAAPNVYSTAEPAETMSTRIAFCLDVHNEAVKSMRYPPRPANAALESAEKAREREREEEEFREQFGGEDDDGDNMDDM